MISKILFLAFVFIYLLLFGCTTSDSFQKIKVGMTYEEIEELVDKPNSILRGVNELYAETKDISYNVLRTINLDTTINLITNKRWILPNKIRNIGSLLYVTWVYEKVKSDTFFVLYNRFGKTKDTTAVKIPIYYLDNRQVTPGEYNKSNGYEYSLGEGRPTSYENYYRMKNSKLFKNLPPPKKINKRLEYRPSKVVNEKEIISGVEKKLYKVNYKYCIIFDSSSGRVTEKGFFPFHIEEL